MTANREPANMRAMYSIGTAAQLSGVPLESIRIWERRYGLIQPERSAGGHRQYSDDDVEVLRALKALTENGARIGSFRGESPSAIRTMAAQLGKAAAVPEDLLSAAIAAGRARDAARLAEILDRPLMVGRATELAVQVYLPLMRRVGDMWHAGEIDVATEHFIEKQVTGRLYTMLLNQGRSDGPEALLLCPSGERHEGGLLGAAVTLAQLGFSLTLLGADVPLVDAERVLMQKTPRLVVMAVTIALPAREARKWLKLAALASASGTAFVVGGAGRGAMAGAEVKLMGSLEELESFARGLLGNRR